LTPTTNERPPRGARTPPGALIPLILMCAAVLAGAFLRWPIASEATQERVFAAPRAREAWTAALSLRAGQGMTVPEGAERRPTSLPAGEVVALAYAPDLAGGGAAGVLTVQAVLSTLALILTAIAAGIAAGPLAAAGAAILMALDTSQISAVRAASPVPLLTCLAAGSLAAAAWGLSQRTLATAVLAVAGVLAGLAASVNPLAAVLGAGLLVAVLTGLQWQPAVAAVAGFAAGWAPALLHRASVAPPATLAAWIGVDDAGGAVLLDRAQFLGSADAVARLVAAALAVAGILTTARSRAARCVVGYGAGTLAALVGVAALTGVFPGFPSGAAAPAFSALLTAGAALGISILTAPLPVPAAWAAAGAAIPAIVGHASFLDAVKSSPGLLGPRTPVAESTASASAPAVAPVKREPETASSRAESEPATKPVAPAPRVASLPPESRWRRATFDDLERARKVIAGGGGLTQPSLVLSNDCLVLTLRLDSKSLDRGASEPDAVRLCLKILGDNSRLDGLRVKVEGSDGTVLSNVLVPGDRARPFIPKLDDPFESRRMRDWWPRMHL
jgi:hypothetical protein